jgi:hypothetical protein
MVVNVTMSKLEITTILGLEGRLRARPLDRSARRVPSAAGSSLLGPHLRLSEAAKQGLRNAQKRSTGKVGTYGVSFPIEELAVAVRDWCATTARRMRAEPEAVPGEPLSTAIELEAAAAAITAVLPTS